MAVMDEKKSLTERLAEMVRTPETIAKLRSVVNDALASHEIDPREAERLHRQIDEAEARGKASRLESSENDV